jgi:malate synthase
VPIYNLMEDAATAEICRAQIWQWVRHGATLQDGRKVTAPWVLQVCAEQLQKIREDLGATVFDQGRFAEAARIFEPMVTAPEFPEFLTLAAYASID